MVKRIQPGNRVTQIRKRLASAPFSPKRDLRRSRKKAGSMAHSFAALYYHLLFSTKNRRRWIDPAWEDRLYGFLGSVLQRKR